MAAASAALYAALKSCLTLSTACSSAEPGSLSQAPAKTVADCFKFRNKIGVDVAVEALRACVSSKKYTVDEFIHYARICRVERIIKPYLEALL